MTQLRWLGNLHEFYTIWEIISMKTKQFLSWPLSRILAKLSRL